MQPVPDIFRSRVGRKVLLLFLVTALVPLAAMALLSLMQVRALLLDQADRRLTNAAKGYATGVYDRLLTARDAAILLAAKAEIPASVSSSITRSFIFLGRVDATGQLQVVKGTAPPGIPRMVAEFRRASRYPTVVRSSDAGRLFLLQQTGRDGAGDVLAGELDPAYVWGPAEDLKAGTVVCVVEHSSMALLHCPEGQEMNLPDLIETGGAGNEARTIVWHRDGIVHRGRLWAQFMTNDFGAPDWYVAMSVPETEVLAAAHAFRQVFFPIVVLALLMIAWLSMRQVRAMLVPLHILTVGSRRLAANDFDARVTVQSEDEFGELGDAFNSMADQLGRKFRLSLANAEVDRLILERSALDRIVEATLRHATALVAQAQFRVILLDASGSSSGRLMTLGAEGAGTEGLLIEAVELPPGTPFSFASGDEGSSEAPAPAWLGMTEAAAPGSRWLQPLIWGKTACGWLVACRAAGQEFDDDAVRTIGGLANRLAVAVASAWRDVELFQRAHYDSLTGLPNRDLFRDRLRQEIARCRRDGNAFGVMFVDLDHFKAVNDSHGHGAGDVLLCEAADRLRIALREGDTVSRHGGDEFTVLATGVREQGDVLPIARKIIDALSEPFVVNGQACFLSASIGIAMFPDNGASGEELLKHADTAMYRAKAAGRRQAMFFEDRMNTEAIARLSIDRELRRALERGELVLHYQPQVELKSDRVVAAEALVRWNHPERGLLGPGHFLPVAEQSDLICAVGRWVIEEVCRQQQAWRAQGLGLERVSVNVSPRQFAQADFIEHVRANVVEPGLAACLEFEITESVLLERSEELEGKLKQLSEFGCSIALDDFGTGFSSLAYLKRLPVHAVKIDRMFVEDLDRTADARALVEAMIVMSHVLGKWVVAEGAERDTHVATLQGLGCDLVQGYCFSKPLPAADFAAFAKGFERRNWGALAALTG